MNSTATAIQMNSTATAIQRLRDAIEECRRHRHHMRHALSSLEPRLPLDGEAMDSMDDEGVQDLDQFILRFGKLQDAMGMRLLPAVLMALQEPFEDRPMLDKLHRLEKLGYLDSSVQWQELRALRNGFAHGYPDEPEKRAALLNRAMEGSRELEAILDRIEQRLGEENGGGDSG
ncbi:hypothetical protein [Thioalkalivibrio sp. ALE23]|uniref:hypothetical protein n=1 Tax=Thioalkalivibrio sp. ALE23 TaxID=1265495 RepID=UPI00035CF4AD|nr:hypothetical protein [Thioalkalivibrio sp. ALE23]